MNHDEIKKFEDTDALKDGFQEFQIPQNPSIKIVKNTKGYNFEFKILSLDVEELDKIHNEITKKIKQWETKNENKRIH